MARIYAMTDHWTDASQVWRGIEFAITDTGSAAGSTPIRILRNNVVLFEISKDGTISFGSYAMTSSAINAQTGTTYTLLSTDNGRVVTLNNGSAITLTVPSGLGAAFSCMLIQLGAGQVNVVGSGTTINSFSSLTHLAGQYAMGTLFATAANVFVLGGNTA